MAKIYDIQQTFTTYALEYVYSHRLSPQICLILLTAVNSCITSYAGEIGLAPVGTYEFIAGGPAIRLQGRD